MPITATLAMVASARDGGRAAAQRLPVQGDVLHRDRVRGRHALVRAFMLPIAATLAGMFSVAYSLRFTVDVFFGPPATDLPRSRTSRRTGCACRSSCWCWCAWWWACCLPGRWADFWMPRTAGGGRRAAAFSLAVWHGFNTPW
jgi:multicomponent K+:H+ antiporter subunit A